jgi:hypothetical protein
MNLSCESSSSAVFITVQVRYLLQCRNVIMTRKYDHSSMKVLLHRLQLSLVLYLIRAAFVDGFSGNSLLTARQRATTRPDRVCSMTKSDSEESSDSADLNGKGSSTRRGAGSVRRRCVDYPKYAYDAGTKEVRVLTSTGTLPVVAFAA